MGEALLSAGTSSNLLYRDLKKEPDHDNKTCSDDNKICTWIGICDQESWGQRSELGYPGCTLRGGNASGPMPVSHKYLLTWILIF